uniref:Uncharacterized protein n=1 Tax=Anguilla anguilla TaxID=7936 RepID=A0A0E9RYW2_ANGAN
MKCSDMVASRYIFSLVLNLLCPVPLQWSACDLFVCLHRC